MDELIDALQREHDLLERLRFRFLGLQLLVNASEVRFLDWAVHDVQLARHRAREADLVRAAMVDGRHPEDGAGGPALRAMAASAPAPWAGILRDHHQGLSAVVGDIEMHSHHIAQTCRDGLATLARTGRLTAVAIPTATVAATEGAVDITAKSLALPRLDGAGGAQGGDELPRAPSAVADLDPLDVERLLGETLASASRLQMPALLAFLR